MNEKHETGGAERGNARGGAHEQAHGSMWLMFIEQTMKMMDSAKASNDPAKMRTALDQARKPLSQMKEHMGMCMNMMNMMESMHGKGGMMTPKPPQQD